MALPGAPAGDPLACGSSAECNPRPTLACREEDPIIPAPRGGRPRFVESGVPLLCPIRRSSFLFASCCHALIAPSCLVIASIPFVNAAISPDAASPTGWIGLSVSGVGDSSFGGDCDLSTPLPSMPMRAIFVFLLPLSLFVRPDAGPSIADGLRIDSLSGDIEASTFCHFEAASDLVVSIWSENTDGSFAFFPSSFMMSTTAFWYRFANATRPRFVAMVILNQRRVMLSWWKRGSSSSASMASKGMN
mmetsp:Transcript_10141/g.23796  ORF Transcript_10141/g.23796 Transcript_10141/m.23796 type:complete len:247 (+) Transcript_10141:484-1224(+)